MAVVPVVGQLEQGLQVAAGSILKTINGKTSGGHKGTILRIETMENIEESKLTVPYLIRLVRAEPDPKRLEAIESLVAHDNPNVRFRSLEVASYFYYPHLNEICLKLLSDSHWAVRLATCEYACIADIVIDPRVPLHLIKNDSNDYIKYHAAALLGKVGTQENILEMLILSEQVTGENHEGTTVKDMLLISINRINSNKQ